MADVAMADDNDDNWLYGDSNAEPPENGTEDLPNGDDPVAEPTENAAELLATEDQDPEHEQEQDQDDTIDDQNLNDEHFEDGEQPGDDNGDGQENGDSDSDSEDDVKVIIGEVKSGPQQYPSLNIKRGGLIAQAGLDKQKQTGKFSVEEFESVGTINGVPAQEFNIDVLEDKPWRKPGADLTDYFNYGFNEDTWRGYCERQKRMRIHESGTGLVPLGGATAGQQQPRQLTPILNDNSKYSVGFTGLRKAGPPPGRKLTGPIDVIGGRRDGSAPEGSPTEPSLIKSPMQIPVRENAIQVMTADRREYSRGKAFPDMSLPPPGALGTPPGDFFMPTEQPFYPPPYHPEDNWGGHRNDSGWTPSDIKQLTPGPMGMGMGPMGPPMGPPPGMGPPGIGPPPLGPPGIGPPPLGPPPMSHNTHYPPPMHQHPRDMDRDMGHRDRDKDIEDMRDKEDRENSELRDRDRDRDRERDRSRSIKPDRHREKSHRRERSRSRSRRHKSRSRSPSSRHRTKKKTHRKDKEDSE